VGEGECCRSSTEGEEILRDGLRRKVQEIGSVRDLGRRLGARDSDFFPSLPSVWCGIARAIPPAGAEQDRRGARQDEAMNVAPKNVHALFFLVVGV